MIILSIDPGREASWARYDTARPFEIEAGVLNLIGRGRLLRPCPIHLARLVEAADGVIVEEVGAMKEQGVSSMFTFGLCVGTILGTLSACNKPLILVTPQEWKKATRLGGLSRDVAKHAARHYATELWPSLEPQLRVKGNHGMAEAALMARWFFMAGPGLDVALEDNVPVRRPATRLAAPPELPEAPVKTKAARKKDTTNAKDEANDPVQ